MNKISVVINTYNAEQHLAAVLESVNITFERKQYNIVEPAREYAIHEAKHEWVLVVDADELVTPELKDYLYQHIENHGANGLFIPRKNYFMGRFLHCHYPDHILRFLRKDKTHWPPFVHSTPEIDGKVDYIPGRKQQLAFIHLANDSVANIVAKTNQYTFNELERKRHRHYGTVALLWRPFFRFFKTYVLKGGFRDGKPGFIKSVLDGYYQFVFLAKKYEEESKNTAKSSQLRS